MISDCHIPGKYNFHIGFTGNLFSIRHVCTEISTKNAQLISFS